MEGYHTYKTLADRDAEPVRAQVLRHLAGAEWEHAALWQGRIVELGGPEPEYKGNPGGEANSLANRAGGVRMALRRLEIEESRHIANYGKQLKDLGDEGSIAILDHVIEDEKDHHRELGSLLRGHYSGPRRQPHSRPQGRSRRTAGQAQPGPQTAGQPGSATPSTASMTASAPSSASCPACPAPPPAMQNMFFSPASPA